MPAELPQIKEFKCKLLLGDTKDVLKSCPDNVFHCAITSPPYWDQRDYKVTGQLGQENTPEQYVNSLVSICKEVKRVLRHEGTFWLNIGDGYCKKTIKSSNLKQQDLIGIPWMVAFALRKDGWYLRSDIIWKKENPQPESVTNRPSKSHEHLFLFAKSKKYFYDAESIKEPQKEISIRRAFSKNKVEKRKDFKDDNYAISGSSQDKTYHRMREKIARGEEMLCNKKDVWSLPTANSKFKHFACVDEETECLTLYGWKKYNELKIGEIVASFDYKKTEKIRWERLDDLYIYDCHNEDMIETKNLNANFLFTPNHRMVCKKKNKDGYFIKEIQHFLQNDIAPVSGEWEDGSFNIVKSPSLEFAELLGWISAEAYYRKYSISIYQSLTVNPIKCKRIEYLLNKSDIKYKKYIRTRKRKDYYDKIYKMICFSIKGIDSLKIRKYIHDKKPTQNMILWSKKAIESFLAGFIGGDGHIRKDKRISICQKDKETIDILQILCFRCGFRTTLSKVTNKNMYVLYLTNKKHTSFRKTNGGGMMIYKRKYTGKIWCPKTASTTFIARRKGRIIITGNSFPNKLVEPCLLAGTSSKGCCSKCKSPWIRKKDISKWKPSCNCKEENVQECMVLDPFNGSGTTGRVCMDLNRKYVGIDINEDYIKKVRNDFAENNMFYTEMNSLTDFIE